MNYSGHNPQKKKKKEIKHIYENNMEKSFLKCFLT